MFVISIPDFQDFNFLTLTHKKKTNIRGTQISSNNMSDLIFSPKVLKELASGKC